MNGAHSQSMSSWCMQKILQCEVVSIFPGSLFSTHKHKGIILDRRREQSEVVLWCWPMVCSGFGWGTANHASQRKAVQVFEVYHEAIVLVVSVVVYSTKYQHAPIWQLSGTVPRSRESFACQGHGHPHAGIQIQLANFRETIPTILILVLHCCRTHINPLTTNHIQMIALQTNVNQAEDPVNWIAYLIEELKTSGIRLGGCKKLVKTRQIKSAVSGFRQTVPDIQEVLHCLCWHWRLHAKLCQDRLQCLLAPNEAGCPDAGTMCPQAVTLHCCRQTNTPARQNVFQSHHFL